MAEVGRPDWFDARVCERRSAKGDHHRYDGRYRRRNDYRPPNKARGNAAGRTGRSENARQVAPSGCGRGRLCRCRRYSSQVAEISLIGCEASAADSTSLIRDSIRSSLTRDARSAYSSTDAPPILIPGALSHCSESHFLKARNRVRQAALLGLAFDAEDGQKRLTRGENFVLFGGSQETHGANARNGRQNQQAPRPRWPPVGRRFHARDRRDLPRNLAARLSKGRGTEGRSPCATGKRSLPVLRRKGRFHTGRLRLPVAHIRFSASPSGGKRNHQNPLSPPRERGQG